MDSRKTRCVTGPTGAWLVSALLVVALVGCGGNDSGRPTPVPTRPVPTPVPGAPTMIPPRFPASATPTPTTTPAMMGFSFRNACAAAQEVNLRLFDVTAGLIYLDNMRDYVITSSVRAISIVCLPGDSICYGGQGVVPTPPLAQATPTPNPALTFGVGLNNDQECSDCCFTCVGGKTIPQINLRCP